MASVKVGLFLPLLLLAVFFLSSPVHCDDEEESLFTCLNSHRAYLDLPIFVQNDGAECVAKEVADKLSDEPCDRATTNKPYQVDHNITEIITSQCELNLSHTKEGVVLPVCVPELVPTQVFTNYTRTHFAKYINDSSFAQVGLGSEGDWMVVVLSTNTSGGDFAPSSSSSARPYSLFFGLGFGHNCLVSFLFGLLVHLAY